MIKKVIIIILFVSFNSVYSQVNRNIHAVYSFYNLNKGDEQIVNLFISKNKAFSEFLIKDKAKDTLFIDDEDTINFKVEPNDSIGKQYHIENQLITFRDIIYEKSEFKEVIVEETIPDYKWELKNESKKIGKFTCNFATLKFRGRDYNVWYTTEIATPFGPWKFYGLPGLIVEVETSDKSIKFQLSFIEFNSFKEINIPNQGTEITFKEYVDFKRNEINDYIEKLKSKLPRGAVVKVNSINSTHLEKDYN
ncbi:GLPGLI family protein [Winogradskyella sp. R77965]|uniref:GLPGLI family protein n=1 Tax=Winogradskyella sp. R77965 TaxID=3093872 RepID=UPI0037DDAE7F